MGRVVETVHELYLSGRDNRFFGLYNLLLRQTTTTFALSKTFEYNAIPARGHSLYIRGAVGNLEGLHGRRFRSPGLETQARHNVHRLSIARLSPEVILEIFRWAVVLDCEKLAMGFGRLLAGRSLTKDASIPDPPKSAPFNISCVSRTWREIAFANSSLWSTVIVDERPSNNISREVAWLGHSGQLPLSIRLQRDTEINLVSSFKSLIPHIFSKGIRERLRDVRIRSYTYMDFPDMTFKDAPFLEELSIRLPFVSFENQAALTVDISKSPRLRSLHLDGYFIAKFSPTNRFTPLTELDLQYDCRLGSESACPHAQDILDLLPSAPNLQALRVMLSDKTLPSNSRSDFHLPNLRIFGIAITDGSAEATQSFMDCITFPSLETFETRILRWFSVLRWTPCFENTLALFERSKAPITKFRLEADMSGIDDGLSDWLQLMPQLKSLTLEMALSQMSSGQVSLGWIPVENYYVPTWRTSTSMTASSSATCRKSCYLTITPIPLIWQTNRFDSFAN